MSDFKVRVLSQTLKSEFKVRLLSQTSARGHFTTLWTILRAEPTLRHTHGSSKGVVYVGTVPSDRIGARGGHRRPFLAPPRTLRTSDGPALDQERRLAALHRRHE